MADPVITHSEILRDKIFEFLPAQARNTLIGVDTTYWPNNYGEMVLKLHFDALDSLLDIEAREGIYGPDQKLTGHLVKGCELNAHTGEIHAYSEGMEIEDGSDTLLGKDDIASERNVTQFNETTQRFFLNLFDCL